MRELWRREEPSVLEVRVGFVRVCRDEVRRFEVPRVVVAVAMVVEEGCFLGARRCRGRGCGQAFIFCSLQNSAIPKSANRAKRSSVLTQAEWLWNWLVMGAVLKVLDKPCAKLVSVGETSFVLRHLSPKRQANVSLAPKSRTRGRSLPYSKSHSKIACLDSIPFGKHSSCPENLWSA